MKSNIVLAILLSICFHNVVASNFINVFTYTQYPCTWPAGYTACGGTTGCPVGSTSCSVNNPPNVTCDSAHCMIPANVTNYSCNDLAQDAAAWFQTSSVPTPQVQCTAVRCPTNTARQSYCTVKTDYSSGQLVRPIPSTLINVAGYIEVPCAWPNITYAGCGGLAGCPTSSTSCNPSKTGCDPSHCVIPVDGLPAYQSSYTCASLAQDVASWLHLSTVPTPTITCNPIRCPVYNFHNTFCTIKTF